METQFLRFLNQARAADPEVRQHSRFLAHYIASGSSAAGGGERTVALMQFNESASTSCVRLIVPVLEGCQEGFRFGAGAVTLTPQETLGRIARCFRMS